MRSTKERLEMVITAGISAFKGIHGTGATISGTAIRTGPTRSLLTTPTSKANDGCTR